MPWKELGGRADGSGQARPGRVGSGRVWSVGWRQGVGSDELGWSVLFAPGVVDIVRDLIDVFFDCGGFVLVLQPERAVNDQRVLPQANGQRD